VQTYQADGLTALGDPTPAGDLRAPRGTSAVGELASDLPVSRPAVSQYLKVLKNARLVVDQRAGSRRVYQVDPEGQRLLRGGYLDHFWTKPSRPTRRPSSNK
jgi:DNA-binding transcriptional ArsR family regulator